ncbi:heavy metal translocating P-type ATPase [Pseudoroseomonas globiformis]|uniref:P-type Zn(2+) transporter n=1 Tax=Teichococcus globiformis TaxID=2307229 RepID=A0ABV7G5R9_9PROT
MDGGTRHGWKVGGMDCAACVAKVTRAVERLPGVSEVSVNLMAEELFLDLAPGTTAPGKVRDQVSALGYSVTALPIIVRPDGGKDEHAHDGCCGRGHPDRADGPEPEARYRWKVEGMDCAACVAKVTRAVERLPGVSGISVNLMAEELSLRLGPHGRRNDVEAQVAALGYAISPLGDPHAVGLGSMGHAPGHEHGPVAHSHGAADPARPWHANRQARLVLLLGTLVGAASLAGWLWPAAAAWLYLTATLVAVVPFGRRAVALARAGSPFSIETLMVTAAIGAALIGAAGEAALVVFLFATGEWLEGVAAGRARAGIRALVEMMPRTARRERGGRVEEVAADSLAPGETILIRPGDRVPCDGTIAEGRSALDESPVTGESQPVARGPGDPVVAGSINADGVLRVTVTHAGPDSTLARIARMVTEATASRGRTQRFIERFSNVWTPGSMAVAALVALLPPLLGGGDWSTWLYRGLALLLVACPCALVISVPAAMASGLSAGARHGMLVKGGAALEAIGGARTVAFDKTGTLTEGRPRVTDILPAPYVREEEVLRLASGLEAGSSHPLARAILAEARVRAVTPPPLSAAAAIPGQAVTGTLEGQPYALGSPGWAAEAGHPLPSTLAGTAEALEAEGKTVVALVRDGEVMGLVAMRDEPRADAAAGIASLRRLGLRCVMLTGDNPRTGAAIGRVLDLEVRAGLRPEGKLREIAALRQQGPVVMVGDGINDAPALAAASSGIAMGGSTDVALEAADAALMRERVGGVAGLVALSRATLGNVKQNVAVAVGLKLIFLVTTVAGISGLWMAILADTGATVLVTLNALRLLRWRPAQH